MIQGDLPLPNMGWRSLAMFHYGAASAFWVQPPIMPVKVDVGSRPCRGNSDISHRGGGELATNVRLTHAESTRDTPFWIYIDLHCYITSIPTPTSSNILSLLLQSCLSYEDLAELFLLQKRSPQECVSPLLPLPPAPSPCKHKHLHSTACAVRLFVWFNVPKVESHVFKFQNVAMIGGSGLAHTLNFLGFI